MPQLTSAVTTGAPPDTTEKQQQENSLRTGSDLLQTVVIIIVGETQKTIYRTETSIFTMSSVFMLLTPI